MNAFSGYAGPVTSRWKGRVFPVDRYVRERLNDDPGLKAKAIKETQVYRRAAKVALRSVTTQERSLQLPFPLAHFWGCR